MSNVDSELSPEQEHAAYDAANKAVDGLHLETLRSNPEDIAVVLVRRSDNGEVMAVNVGPDGKRYVSDSDGSYRTTESGEWVVGDSDDDIPRPRKALQIAEGIEKGVVVEIRAPESIETRKANIEIASALFELRYPESADGLNEDDIRIERPDGGVLELHYDPETKIETLVDETEQEAGESGEYRILGRAELFSVGKKGKLRFAPEKAREYAEAIKNGKQI